MQTTKILLTNVRQLYQCQQLWLVYLFAVVFVGLHRGLVELGGDVTVNMLFPAALAAGFAVASLQEAVAFKPPSFCLPGQRENLRSFIFVVGSAVSLTGGFFFAACMHGSLGLSPLQSVGALYLSLCFTGTLYLISAAVTLILGSTMAMSILMLPIVGMGLLKDPYANFDRTLLDHPLPAAFTAVLLAVVIWRWLGDSGWFRRRYAKPNPCIISSSARSSDKEVRQIAASIKLPQLRGDMEERLLAIMRECDYRRPFKYVFGTLYGSVLPVLLVILRPKAGCFWGLFVFAVLLMAGYSPGIAPFLIFIILQFPATDVGETSPLFSQMLNNGGRRERFHVTVWVTFMLAVVSAMVITMLLLMLNLLAPVLPQGKLYGLVVAFRPISLWLPMLSMIIFPIVGLASFCSHGRQAALVISVVISIAILNVWIFHPAFAVPLWMPVVVATLSWLVFILVIHRIAMRGDLVRR